MAAIACATNTAALQQKASRKSGQGRAQDRRARDKPRRWANTPAHHLRASQMYPMPNEMAEEEDEDIKQMKARSNLGFRV